MKLAQIRKKYLDFFRSKKHAIIESASLIPGDPTTLFTGSGMQPLIPYLLGEKHPKGKRLANSQKCFRAEDIEEVGDNRHTTFFEMLGNWSLGDYFKKEQLSWYFEFLTKELKINPEKLYVTVFKGNEDIERDSESVSAWKDLFKGAGIDAKDVDFAEKNGMNGGRIFYYDETKNWWSRSGLPKDMPAGEPGGPDSEVFYDMGAELKRHENSEWKNNECHVNCDCGRFVEIGNSVFMEYIKTENGFEKLPQKNVDFGGGLERTAMALQDKASVFETDVFEPIIKKIEKLSGKKYEDETKAFEVIADHVRGIVFLVSEGVMPSNVERGYVVRRLIRRAIRFGKMIEMPAGFLIDLAKQVIGAYQDFYTELKRNKENVLSAIKGEEEKFEKTLSDGLKQFEKIAARGNIAGIDAFHLYDTYGFPLELTMEMAKERNLEVDKKGFEAEFRKHQKISRAGAEKKFGGLGKEAEQEAIKLHTATHLLHQALRQILGKDVRQMGSDITHERLRFDFSYPQKLTQEQIQQVEDLVNEKIRENLAVKKEEMSHKDAVKAGALAFFREKYPEKVNVYSVGGFSKEICAGPHVEKTGELGKFKIIKEESSSAGVRRIKAVLEK